MAKQFRAHIDIHATPQQIWQILTDFDAYPQWNPFMTRAAGTPHPGQRLRIRLQPVSAAAP